MLNNREKEIHHLTRFAQEAILYEVALSPKPGLVDAYDNGAHDDMDLFTFLDSSATLYQALYEFTLAGLEHEGSEKELFQNIRPIGILAEKEMFAATKGVNTHKGIIFSMGIILAATGFYLKNNQLHLSVFTEENSEQLFETIKKMTQDLVKEDFKGLEKKQILTNGEKLYLEYGFTGIRGEAEQGYPVVRQKALPFLRKEADTFPSKKEALLHTLLIIMAETEDSNLVNRGGMEALAYVKQLSFDFIEKGGMKMPDGEEKLRNMNQEFKNRNISPGGAADLLSIVIFIAKLEGLL